MAFNLDLKGPMGILAAVVGAIIAILVVATVFPDFIGAVADINENITNDSVTTGDDSADAIMGVFPLIIGVAAVVGVVGIILRAVNFGKK